MKFGMKQTPTTHVQFYEIMLISKENPRKFMRRLILEKIDTRTHKLILQKEILHEIPLETVLQTLHDIYSNWSSGIILSGHTSVIVFDQGAQLWSAYQKQQQSL